MASANYSGKKCLQTNFGTNDESSTKTSAVNGSKRAVKIKSKRTYLYVVYNGNIGREEPRYLKEFLFHRMGNQTSIDFEIICTSSINQEQINKENDSLLITILFESLNKASVARYMLHASNRGASDKITCFFTQEEAIGSEVDTYELRQSELQKVAREIFEMAESVVTAHEDKMKSVRDNLEKVSEQIGSKRGISMVEYEKLSCERLALEDKLEELTLQRKEFKKYIESMKVKLARLVHEGKFEQKVKEVRMAFGVECRRLATALPMYARREDILNVVKENQVCVILGETGSGKSTQMVQYLYQAGLAADGLIACTQPRKIAATSLATHVSAEMGSSVGRIIGYQVGMQTKMNAETKVVFMTDHILLNECLKDRLLKKYSCILIDEAHERSIHTDLLLGMLKEALVKRPAMKVIITSATIDPEIFVTYFGGKKNCPVLKVSGRTFPVDVIWEQDYMYDSSFPEDYETKALTKAIEIHQATPVEQGDILVFLTSAVEIERCVDRMKQRVGEQNVQCLQLHGRLKPEEQQLVFQPTPNGKRKVVFATNSAETSITIPGIKFVVDTGVVKEMRFDPKKNMNCLDVVAVSQSSANQRKGRAGRTASGICYRLYSERDFNQMEKTSSPEILRIQVSQALLKLLELGVDPFHFQYVQSPTPASMKSAMSELIDIGAVKGTSLTELGKWIARLPVEPRLGVLIKKGLDLDIALESLVVASCCNQSGIFFRVGTQDEKKAADLKKMKFCHIGGDLLTMLNVYREWDQEPEKAKGKWCQTNSINGKAMKGIRETVNEISTSLKKEVNLKLHHEFKSTVEADKVVQKIVFECMKANLGYYLGHDSAGYLIVNRHQRVQLHPSSAILSLGLQPCWVVFNRVLKTSADFMTEVTPVADHDIEWAFNNGSICVDIPALENEKVTRVLNISVGQHVFWKFVGPMHKNRREFEEEVEQVCDRSLIIIEANKQRGRISLFSKPMYAELAAAMLKSKLEPMSQVLLNESREESIGKEPSGIRALLREGGAVIDILMPNQYRSLNIQQKETARYDVDEESARKLLEKYGSLEQIWMYTGKKQSQFCGRVTYTNASDAATATHQINNDNESEISLVPVTTFRQGSTPQEQGYSIKIAWCRRPGKGHCFISSDHREDILTLLGSSVIIKGKLVRILRSKKQSDLYIKDLASDVTEEDIKEGLVRELGLPNNKDFRNRFRVIVPRPNVSPGLNEWQSIQEQLGLIVERYSQRATFRVTVREIQPKNVMGNAFVTFTDPLLCYNTGTAMMVDNLTLAGHKIEVSFECKSKVHVKRALYDMIRQDIEILIDGYKARNASTVIEIRELKSGHISLDITATSPQSLAADKVKVDKIVGGDEFECGDKANLHVLFSKEGKQIVHQIGKTTETLVFTDERRMKITIQGLKENREQAWKRIEEYVSKCSDLLETEVRLKGDENPPGLTKALLLKYGYEFDELKKETGISGVRLNLRYHEITIKGKEDSVRKAVEKITELREEMGKGLPQSASEETTPDCPICLCPVSDSDICRLEYCGHAYCKVCLSTLLKNAMSEMKVPVVCAAENCGKSLVIRDINYQIKMGNIKRKELLKSALTSLVTNESDRFRFCITPDCDAVYRVSTNGEQFMCPICFTRICTSCHLSYHDGLTCAMYQDARKGGDLSMMNWLKEDPNNRKICPKCHSGIEKNGGCNHMTCKCGAHICWFCLQYFSNGGDCVNHMARLH